MKDIFFLSNFSGPRYFQEVILYSKRFYGGHVKNRNRTKSCIVELQGLGLKLGVDFNFAWDNHNYHNHNQINPHLDFVKGRVLGDKEQEVRIRDKG